MKKRWHIIIFLMILSFGCGFTFVKGGLIPEPLKAGEHIEGTFTLILYGANHADDLETIALLDKEGDTYQFEPYAPEFVYRTKKHLSSKEALAEAEKFVGWHHSFRNAMIFKIRDENGSLLGYEVRPLYYPLDFGFSDILDVNYFKRGNKIIVRIKLIAPVERQLSGDDRKGIFD